APAESNGRSSRTSRTPRHPTSPTRPARFDFGRSVAQDSIHKNISADHPWHPTDPSSHPLRGVTPLRPLRGSVIIFVAQVSDLCSSHSSGELCHSKPDRPRSAAIAEKRERARSRTGGGPRSGRMSVTPRSGVTRLLPILHPPPVSHVSPHPRTG